MHQTVNKLKLFLTWSVFYRSVLRECIENIQEENRRFRPESNIQHYNNCIALLYNLEFIWHLTEVIYIVSIPG